MLGIPLETWVLGAILALIGALVIACSFGQGDLSVAFALGGITSVSVGSIIFIAKFKKWIESFCKEQT